MTKTKTREAWLRDATKHLTKVLMKAGAPAFPQPTVSVGIPSRRGLSKKNPANGECWSEVCSEDGRPAIFISPLLDGQDSRRVLSALLHELVHAAVGHEHGHRGPFADLADAVGLPRPHSDPTLEIRDPLALQLAQLHRKLGDMPHVRIDPALNGRKKDRTRLRKYVCDRCGQVLRVSGPVGKIVCKETYREKGNPKSFLDEPRKCGGTFIDQSPPPAEDDESTQLQSF